IYTGASTCDEVIRAGDVGLAEFTGAHFFSEDTLIGGSRPRPCPNDTQLSDSTDASYYQLSAPNSNVVIAHAARRHGRRGGYSIDDSVSKDYGTLLVPEAVAYGGAFFDYFFRGLKLDVRILTGQQGFGSDGFELSNNIGERLDNGH